MNGRSFWALPGPESFCDRILGNLVEGKSVVLFLPERMPDGLKRTVMSDVAREAPDKCFYELFPSDFDPEDSPLASLFRFFEVKPEKGWSGDFLSCETLVQSESFKNGIVWIEEADGQNIRDWLSFLRKYEKASRNIELTERTLFCFCVVGLPPESVEIKQDVCLKFLPWKGYVDFFDMLLYAHWNFPVISEGGLRRELAVNMAACLALWDPEVIERLAESSFLNTLSPYSVLEELGRGMGRKRIRTLLGKRRGRRTKRTPEITFCLSCSERRSERTQFSNMERAEYVSSPSDRGTSTESYREPERQSAASLSLLLRKLHHGSRGSRNRTHLVSDRKRRSPCNGPAKKTD